jgi:hypothetical protein
MLGTLRGAKGLSLGWVGRVRPGKVTGRGSVRCRGVVRGRVRVPPVPVPVEGLDSGPGLG